MLFCYVQPGADLGFSRNGGGGIFKNISKILKNGPKKAFLGTFWKFLTKKSRFFGARSPLKISILAPKLDFLKVPKKGPFGSAGGRIPEKRLVENVFLCNAV